MNSESINVMARNLINSLEKVKRIIFIFGISLTGLATATTPIVASGKYEMTLGIAGNNIKTPICYSLEEVSSLSAFLLTLEEPLMRQHCTVEILESAEKTASWKIDCQSPFGARTTEGTIHWDKESFSGHAIRIMGQIRMEFPFEAKRIGNCS